MGLPDVPVWVIGAVEGWVVVVVQGGAVDPEQFVSGQVKRVRQAHGAQVVVAATSLEDVIGHVRIVAGRAVQDDCFADGFFQDRLGVADLPVHHLRRDHLVAPRVVAHAPAAGEQVAQLGPVHVAVAVETGVADVPDLAHLADHDFHVAGDAVLLVHGDGEAMQVGQSLVVSDRVNPLLAVFPGTDAKAHNCSPTLGVVAARIMAARPLYRFPAVFHLSYSWPITYSAFRQPARTARRYSHDPGSTRKCGGHSWSPAAAGTCPATRPRRSRPA